MLTHRQLRYFVEIVDAGSFSLAAERLFVAQSALSRQVREMERELQVTLLERDTRHLEATAAGRSLYADARRILAALEAAAANAAHAQRGTEGTLQLLHSSSVPLNARLLAALRLHAQQHRGVSLDIAQASSEHQALEIHEGRADVGLARGPILRRYGGVRYAPLYEERLVALVPEGHALSERADIALTELQNERFVATPHIDRGGLSHRVAELCREHGFSPKSALVCSRKWAQLTLVQGGFGIAIVPESMAAMAPKGVCRVEFQGIGCTSTVLAMWRHEASPLVARFVEILRATAGVS
ncbi:MAG: LysR family transcriptional regulator [Acidovorax sp.]